MADMQVGRITFGRVTTKTGNTTVAGGSIPMHMETEHERVDRQRGERAAMIQLRDGGFEFDDWLTEQINKVASVRKIRAKFRRLTGINASR